MYLPKTLMTSKPRLVPKADLFGLVKYCAFLSNMILYILFLQKKMREKQEEAEEEEGEEEENTGL